MERFYCDADFLEYFLKYPPSGKRDKYITTIKEQEAITIWNQYLLFFQKREFSIDLTEAELKEKAKNDSFWEEVAFAKVQGEMHITCIGEKYPIRKEEEVVTNLNGIYFSSLNNSLIEALKKKYGVLIINIENIKDNVYLSDSGISIRKNVFYKWEDVFNSKISICNSIVLIDNYIFSQSGGNDVNDEKTKLKGIYYNLFPILNCLLPNEMDTPFHISIFYLKTKEENYKDEKRLEIVQDWLKQMRPKLNVKIGIFKTEKKRDGWNAHDRVILTNYNFIDSGAGFDLLDHENKAVNETNISILYPFIQNNIEWCEDKYISLLEEVKKVYEKAVNTQFVKDYWGDKENRMFFNN